MPGTLESAPPVHFRQVIGPPLYLPGYSGGCGPATELAAFQNPSTTKLTLSYEPRGAVYYRAENSPSAGLPTEFLGYEWGNDLDLLPLRRHPTTAPTPLSLGRPYWVSCWNYDAPVPQGDQFCDLFRPNLTCHRFISGMRLHLHDDRSTIAPQAVTIALGPFDETLLNIPASEMLPTLRVHSCITPPRQRMVTGAQALFMGLGSTALIGKLCGASLITMAGIGITLMASAGVALAAYLVHTSGPGDSSQDSINNAAATIAKYVHAHGGRSFFHNMVIDLQDEGIYQDDVLVALHLMLKQHVINAILMQRYSTAAKVLVTDWEIVLEGVRPNRGPTERICAAQMP